MIRYYLNYYFTEGYVWSGLIFFLHKIKLYYKFKPRNIWIFEIVL
jgi:hypothetical protein